MALDFGKLNFSTSFNPTSAFPLDARCYFENLEAAETAAASAKAAGDSTTVYFFGQQLAVVEDGVATLYIIEENSEGVGELKEVGSKTLGDGNSIDLDESGVLSLHGFSTAGNKNIPYKDTTTGKIVWGPVEGILPDAIVPVGDAKTIKVEADSTDESKRIISLLGSEGAVAKGVMRKKSDGTFEWVEMLSAIEVTALTDALDGRLDVVEPIVEKLNGAASVSGSVAEAKAAADAAQTSINSHEADTTNPHSVTKAQVGLSNVTNDAQVKRSEMGVANGVATLDANGLVPSGQLPSYVDDVIEVENYASLPTTGEAGKIYVTKDDNKTYRWSGTIYVEISASLALGETSGTAYEGSKGKALDTRLTQAENAANTLKGRVDVIEPMAHTHSNKDELDKVKSGDVAKWDAAEAKAHEHSNKSELDKFVSGDKAKLDATETKSVANEAAIAILNGSATTAGSVAKAKAEAISAAEAYSDEQLSTKVGAIGTGTVKAYVDSADNALDARIDVLEGQVEGKIGELGYLDEVDEAHLAAALASKINNKADKATTLAGYGITDAYTQAETNSAIATAEAAAIAAAAEDATSKADAAEAAAITAAAADATTKANEAKAAGIAAAEAVQGNTTETVASLNTKINGLDSVYAAKSLETTVSNHIADTTAHITSTERTNWNTAATKANTNETAIAAINDASTGILKQAKDYADGKDTAIAAAKAAGDNAQATIDAYKTSNDARVSAIEDAIGETGDITAAIADAKQAGLDAQEQVEELAEGAVATNTAAIATLNGAETADGSVRKIAKGYADSKDAAIAEAQADATQAIEDAADAQADVDALEIRVGAAETDIDNLQALHVSGKTVAQEVATGTAALKSEILGDAATDYNTLGKVEDKIIALQGVDTQYGSRISANEAGIAALEGKISGVFHLKGEADKQGDDLYIKGTSTKITGQIVGDTYIVGQEEWTWSEVDNKWIMLGVTTDLSNYYNKNEIDGKLNGFTGAFHFKGVATQFDAQGYPIVAVKSEGDIWLNNQGEQFAWNGSEWVKLGYMTDLSAYSTTAQVQAMIDGKLTGLFRFKGSVATKSALPTGASNGDVYVVEDENNKQYAWDGEHSKWVVLTTTVDLSSYSTTAEVNTLINVAKADVQNIAATDATSKVTNLKTELVSDALTYKNFGVVEDELESQDGRLDSIESTLNTPNTGLVAVVSAHGTRLNDDEADIDELQTKVAALEDAPSADIKSSDIAAWNGEIGAMAKATANATAISELESDLLDEISRAEGAESALDGRLDTVEEKLEGVEEGAQVNKIEQIKIGNEALTISNKAVTLPLATASKAGIVVSSTAANKVAVGTDGTMEVNSLNVQKLFVADGDEFTLNGGNAQ